MNAREKALLVVSELREALMRIPLGLTEEVCDVLLKADEIFVAGAGRSGLMARAFCMRLMHLGLRSYMVGEVVTPNLRSSGVLVICSGSGETKSLVSMAEKAVSLGAPIVLVTINPDSTVGKLASVIVKIDAPSPKALKEGDIVSIQPMGNLFEQSLLLYLDIVIMVLMDRMNIDKNNMFSRHANLE
ncbi:MAG: 6-phospho-3-hexuloisomerase [Firmicutes bacterium HGW-Firmicutes-20]|jgi:6-phospho-3-hexuloisomerase|nr:MAG: 6-phospho-3-hexuloisomerase [Firmicutes bacterium HGW-Firmicutes-20]PKM89138.1 MAG: 6-phospho-3-hexuloisomerase [Firmicutes bacterium HGW-Firmicutes-10]